MAPQIHLPSSTILSPNGKIRVILAVKKKLEPYPSGNRLYYRICFNKKNIIVDSPLGFDFKNMSPIAEDLIFRKQERSTFDETWSNIYGKCSSVRNHYNQVKLQFETQLSKRRLELIFRVYDDGVAFRFFFPHQTNMREFLLTSERSQFHFARNHHVWAAEYSSYHTGQEAEFKIRKLSSITYNSIIGLPLLVRIDRSRWIAICEANLTDWAGMYLEGVGYKQHALVTRLSPRLDDPEILVRSRTPRISPWRVIMIGEEPGDLIESNIIMNLNEPCAMNDISWIKPGKSVWRWWSDSYIPDAKFEVGVNTQTIEHYAKFAADMDFEYVLIDSGWYGPPLDHHSDITTSIPEVDMQEILRSAEKQNLKVIVWLHWTLADKQMEKAFPVYEEMGIAGVKIDFMCRDDQEMVNFYHRVIKKAAEHHLIVDFHGAYKPTGLRRTYPNLITREGVLGNEHNKWGNRVTPDHNVTLPFTRMLIGPMDYTPGGFRHTSRKNFKAQNTGPFVMGTRCHQLAMMVVFESPLQVLCDSPYNYRGEKGLDFIRIVPTTWDDTRVLYAEVGHVIILARRSGREWFIGGMKGDTASLLMGFNKNADKPIEVSLEFLEEEKYTLHSFSDSADSHDFPHRVNEKEQRISRLDLLTINMIRGGGYVAHLSPI